MPASPGGSAAAMVWLARQTASTTATLDFAGLISSTYETYIFILTQVRPATDGANMYMRVGTGGGPTYDSGSTSYDWATWRWVNNASLAAGSGAGGGLSYMGLDGGGAIDNGADSSMSGEVRMFNPSSGTLFTRFTWQTQNMDNAATNLVLGIVGGGRYRSTTAVTAVRFLASSGMLTSGTIDMYGLTHA